MAAELHDILLAACSNDERNVPEHPLRSTAPALPWISPPGWGKAALWIAEHVLRPATEIERDALDEAAHILGITYERAEIDPELRGSERRLDYAELAKRTAEQVDRRDAQMAQYYARAVASHALTADVLDREQFLRALDDELFRLEATELVTEYGGDGDSIEAALWRGEGKKARLGRCIVRTTDGYGIVIKLKGRYQWFAGGRADVLATIPDAELDAALEIVEACEARRSDSRDDAIRLGPTLPSRTSKKPKVSPARSSNAPSGVVIRRSR